jgi:6-phosphogluconolactonase
MTESPPEIVVLDDAQAVAEEAAARWVALAGDAIAARGRFTVALSGGSTPRALYERLARPSHREGAPWANTHVFWGDERAVPPAHADSNYRMVHEALLAHVALPLDNIHRVRGENAPQYAAADYEQVLRLAFELRSGQFPRFDLVLLGMGADGHTASLFPDNPALDETGRLFIATHVPQLDNDRLTMTLPAINAAAHIMFLVVGEGKADTLRDVLQGDPDPTRLPAQAVHPTGGQLTWLLDKAAASALSL